MRQKLGLVFLHYIRFLAKLQVAKINFFRQVLGQKSIKVVGVTGSAGKTSTMLAIAAALEDSFKVKCSLKANSESGIPLNILGLKMSSYGLADWFKTAFLALFKLLANWKNYDVYVVEMGVDEPKEPKNMSYLLRIVRPEIGVFTGVTSVHGMQFEEVINHSLEGEERLNAILEAIADEKAKLISSLPEDGFAVLNFDDDLVRERKKLTLAKIIGVGRNQQARIKLVRVETSLQKTRVKYEVSGRKDELVMQGQVLPQVYGVNFGLAIGVADALGVSPEKAIKGIEDYFQTPPGRSSLIEGIKGVRIIDSSYNSSPKALEDMLDLLDQLSKRSKRKKVAVLGDMRELGQQSKIEHQRVARKAAKTADQIVLVGPEMKDYFLPEVLRAGFGKKRIKSFLKAGQAADFLEKNLKGKELILIKGSQNTIFLEIVVQRLMKKRSLADNLLCRRGKYWDNQRKALS